MAALRRVPIAAACAAALSLPSTPAAGYDAIVFFGDSLTDSGTFGAKFTTNPGPVWSELLAGRLGTSATPFFSVGGTNFAVGGARVTQLPGVPNSPPTDSAPPVSTQIDAFFAGSGGAAPSGNLYTVWAGANDVFVAPNLGAGAAAYLTQTAVEAAGQIGRLQAAGARFILVPNVPDIGATPFGVSQGPAGAAAFTQLTQGYNRDLYGAIAAQGLRVIALDTFGLLREVTADPATYGLVNVSTPACGATASLLCTPADLVAPDAAQTFLYADGVHPTTAGHTLMADYAASVLTAPEKIARLAETPLRARSALVDRLHVRIADAARTPAGRNVWVMLDGAEDSGAGLTLGADFARGTGWVLGGALGFATSKPGFEGGGNYRQEETVGSLYAGWSGGPWRANAIVSYGAIGYDVNREIHLGPATRTATASPDGSNLSAGLEGGYRFSAGRLVHGPFAGLLWQRAEIDAFAEDGAGSASLRYGAQKRNSAAARLGWELAYDAGRFQPYARLSLERELRDSQRELEAQLVTAPELPLFSMPVSAPKKDSATLLAGAGVQLAPGWRANFGVAHGGPSGDKTTGVFATLAMGF